MSTARKRVETLQATLRGARTRFKAATYQAIDNELNEAASARRVSPDRRRHLLQIVHHCRALDSALRQVVDNNGGNARNATMGQCLRQLLNPPMSLIDKKTYDNFQNDVVHPRNTFMHEADAFPSDAYETSVHLGNIELCFCQIVALA